VDDCSFDNFGLDLELCLHRGIGYGLPKGAQKRAIIGETNVKLFANSAGDGYIATLTRAECEVLAHVACGLPNKEIAYFMYTTPRTIESYIAELLRGLGFSNRVQLARWAYFYPSVLFGAACEVNLHLPGCACSHPRCVELQRQILAAEATVRQNVLALPRRTAALG
jgi:DNA-binding CsgD family transcriptional regulator